MRLRSVPISAVISVSFVAVFCLALIHETKWGQVIIGIITSIPYVWWTVKIEQEQDRNRKAKRPKAGWGRPPSAG
jgi:hypothetical protein